jgi:hypothetical protein
MRRWSILLLALAGCETLSPFEKPANTNIVPQGELSPLSQQAAERLDQVGRQILSTNPFLASAPAFGFIGTKDPELFHQNAEAVFASEGLITKCQSDDELAALLCIELARITAESRNLARLGLPEPDTTLPGPATEPDPEQADLGGAADVGQASRPEKRIRTLPVTNVMALAADWHKNAGYKPEAFAKAELILKIADANSITSKQLGGPSAAPRWSK